MDKYNANNVVELEEFEKERGGKGIGGKILAVSLGFIIGIGSTIGGLAAIGAWVLKHPVKDAENLVQIAKPDLDLSEYLTDEYYNGTVLNLLGGVRDAITQISEGKAGFGALAQISPKVKTSIRDLAKKFKELGSNLEEDKIFNSLMSLPFSEFGTYLTQTLISSVELGPMLLGSKTFTFDVLTNDNTMMALLYGVEGEDYIIEEKEELDENGKKTIVKKITPVEGGRKPLSIGDMQDGGIEPVFEEIPIDALLTVNEDDGVMTSLAYGSSSHYTFVDSDEKGEDGKPIRVVKMTPRVYTSENGEDFYDEEGTKLDCEATPITGVDNAYKLTFKDSENNVIDVQYVCVPKPQTAALSQAQEPSQAKTYNVYKDEAMKKELTFKKTSFADLMHNSEGLMETLEIASLMDVTVDSNPVLIALAYGVEDEDYIIEETETTDAKGNKTIVKVITPLPGKKPKTLSQLQGEEMDNFVNDLPLASLVEVNMEDDIIMTLAYGSENKYIITEEDSTDKDGKPIKIKTGVEMKQVEFTRVNNKWYDIDHNLLDATFNEETGILTVKEETEQPPESGSNENAGEGTGEGGSGENAGEGTGGTVTKTTQEFYIVYNEDDEKYYQFDMEDHTKPVKYPKTTVGTLQHDSSSLIDSMELGALLDVNPHSNPMIIALAYGVEDEDYIIEEKEETDQNGNKTIVKVITPLPGKKPKTVGDLSNGGVDETIHNLPLDSMMTIDLEDGMMTSLAYGASNRYTFIEENGTDKDGNPIKIKTGVEMKQVEFTCKDGVWRDIDGHTVTVSSFDEETGILTITEKTEQAPESGSGEGGTTTTTTKDIYVVYDEEDKKYYQFDVEDHAKPVKYPKTTVGKLQDNPASLIDEIQLGEVLNVTPETENPDKLLFALAYGNKGEHYDYNANGEFYFKTDENGTPYKARTLGDLRGEENLFNTIYIGDALNVTPASHSVLIALAYGEEDVDYKWVEKKDKNGNVIKDEHNQPIMEIKMLGESKPRTINELQGDNSEGLINSITVESALGVNTSSTAMMRAIAYGQEGVHYETIEYETVDGVQVPKTDKIQMKQAIYTPVYDETAPTKLVGFLDDALRKHAFEEVAVPGTEYEAQITVGGEVRYLDFDETDGKYYAFDSEGNALSASYTPIYTTSVAGFLDRFDKQVNVDTPLLITLVDTQAYEITLADESKQYVLKEDFSVFAIDYTNPGDPVKEVPYAKTTLGQLSNDSQAIMDDVTLGDAMGITKDEPDGLKRSLAFDKKGNPYTIGQLSNNPSLIIDSMTVADALGVTPDSERMIIALAYGQRDLHYYIEEKTEGDVTTKTIKPYQTFYTPVYGDPVVAEFLDSVGGSHAFEEVAVPGTEYEAQVTIDSVIQYLDFNETDGNYYAFDGEGNALGTFYTPIYTTPVVSFLDRFEATYAFEEVANSGNEYLNYEAQITIDGEVRYLDFDETDGKYYAFDSEGNPIDFEPTTIGQLNSNGNGSVIDNITLADALDVDKDDNSSQNSLKHALAYSKDGYAYTIGDFAEDPNGIVNNIEIDSVMHPVEGDATTMYLLYGKEGVHYAISEEMNTTDIPTDATIIPDSYNQDKTRAKYVIMLNKVMTVHQKMNHDTGAPEFDTQGNPIMCVHNEYGESLGDNDTTGVQTNHPIVKSVPTNDEVEIEGNKYNVKFTYTFPNDNNTIYRLLLPQDKTLFEPIRVKGYYTYDHYEPAYLLQTATQDGEGNPISGWSAEKYTPNTISALSESDLISHLTHRLTLEEVIDVDLNDTPILKPIAHTTIDELPGAVNSLTITEVFETDVYKTKEIDGKKQVVNETNQPIYYDRQTKAWYTTPTFETGTESEPVLVSTWKYLLTDATPTYKESASGTFVYVESSRTYREATAEERANPSIKKYEAVYTAPEEYTVNSMGELVGNMTNNIQTATLKDLVDDGIITVSDPEAWASATHLHDWTILKLLNFAMGIPNE